MKTISSESRAELIGVERCRYKNGNFELPFSRNGNCNGFIYLNSSDCRSIQVKGIVYYPFQ